MTITEITAKTKQVRIRLPRGSQIQLPREAVDALAQDWVVTEHKNKNFTLKNLRTKASKQSLQHLMRHLLDLNLHAINDDPSLAMKVAHSLAAHHLPVVNGQERYRPGEGALICLEGGQFAENTWRCNGVTPDPLGSLQFYIEHLQRVMGEAEAEYFLDAIAFQMQSHLVHHKAANIKPQIGFVFCSEAQGVGKGTLAGHLTETLGDGPVKTCPSPQSLMDTNAPNLWKSSLLIIEEAETKVGAAFYRELKTKIGGIGFWAALKYKDVEPHEATAMPILLQNGYPYWLTAADRRMTVIKFSPFSEDKAEQAAYMSEVHNWWAANNGPGRLKHHLLTRDWEANGFSPSAHALRTDIFAEVINANQDDVVSDIQDLMENYRCARLWTTEDFNKVWDRHHMQASGLKRIKLQEAGLKATERLQVPKAPKAKARYWRRKDDILSSRGGARTITWIDDNGATQAQELSDALASRVVLDDWEQ